MDLINKNRLFAWDNEDGETRYFVNGVFLGSEWDFFNLFEASLPHLSIGKTYLIKKIYANALVALSEVAQDKIANFLDTVEILTMEQERALYSYDFKKLLELI